MSSVTQNIPDTNPRNTQQAVSVHVYEATGPDGEGFEVYTGMSEDKEVARATAAEILEVSTDEVLVRYLCTRREWM